MIEQGIYLANIVGGTTSPTEKGGLQVCVDVEVTHQADNGEWGVCGPYKRTVFLSLTDKAMPYSRPKLAKMGFNGDFANMRFSEATVQLECRHEEYNGKTREKWDLVYEAIERKPAAPDQLRRLNAEWKSSQAVAAPPAGNPTAPKPTNPPRSTVQPQTVPEIAPEEIPF